LAGFINNKRARRPTHAARRCPGSRQALPRKPPAAGPASGYGPAVAAGHLARQADEHAVFFYFNCKLIFNNVTAKSPEITY
jgi:hypothetical protein